jgi:hypothetical protein
MPDRNNIKPGEHTDQHIQKRASISITELITTKFLQPSYQEPGQLQKPRTQPNFIRITQTDDIKGQAKKVLFHSERGHLQHCPAPIKPNQY